MFNGLVHSGHLQHWNPNISGRLTSTVTSPRSAQLSDCIIVVDVELLVDCGKILEPVNILDQVVAFVIHLLSHDVDTFKELFVMKRAKNVDGL